MKQIDGKVWAGAWSKAVGEKVAKRRGELGLSAQALGDACSKLGYPIARNTIVNIETGRKESIVVQEISVIAAVLAVPPVWLLYDLTQAELEVLPGAPTKTWWATQWFTGEGYLFQAFIGGGLDVTLEVPRWALSDENDLRENHSPGKSQLDLLREYEKLIEARSRAEHSADEAWTAAGETRTPRVARLESRAEELADELIEHGMYMSAAGLAIPLEPTEPTEETQGGELDG